MKIKEFVDEHGCRWHFVRGIIEKTGAFYDCYISGDCVIPINSIYEFDENKVIKSWDIKGVRFPLEGEREQDEPSYYTFEAIIKMIKARLTKLVDKETLEETIRYPIRRYMGMLGIQFPTSITIPIDKQVVDTIIIPEVVEGLREEITL